MIETSRAVPGKRLVVGLLAVVFAIVALGAWALASPVGASPDDDFHLASIWCGTGEKPFLCEAGENSTQRLLPTAFAKSNCFALVPSRSAACQGSDFGFIASEVGQSARGNFVPDYPPVFYWALGLFAGTNLVASVLVMRLFNILLTVGLLSAVFALVPKRLRVPTIWGLVATAIPLEIFILPSTNPSSWAILSIAGLWPSLLGYFESAGWRKFGLGVLAGIFTLIGAGARADAALYAGLSIAVVMILSAKRTKSFWIAAAPIGGLLLMAVAFFFSAHQSTAASTGIGSGTSDVKSSPLFLLMTNLVEVPTLWSGALGTWGLGWLDTAMPGVVTVLSLMVFASVLLLGFASTWRRKVIVGLLIFGTLWVLPALMLVQTKALVGSYVQPRYILPIMILLAGVALLPKRDDFVRINSTQFAILAAFSSLVFAFALRTNMRRYISGSSNPSWNLNANIEWWWTTPISPMVVWVAGSVAFVGFLITVTPGLLPESWSITGIPKDNSPKHARASLTQNS